MIKKGFKNSFILFCVKITTRYEAPSDPRNEIIKVQW